MLRQMIGLVAVRYLVAQGSLTLLWWVGLVASTRFRAWFVADDSGWAAAQTIVAADCIVFGLGSIVTARLLATGSPNADRVLWAVTGSAWYATLVALMWLAEPIDSALGVLVMVPAAAATTAITVSRSR